MVAKISMGTSLYGALAYNGLKVNEGEGRLLAVNRVFDDGSGRVDVARAEQDFKRFMPEQVRTRNKVIHISLNPHPDDRLTDTELEQLAREYLDRLGYGDQPYLVFKHEDISRHHLHIVSVNVDENGRRLNRDFIHRRSKRITSELEKKYGLHPADRRQYRTDNPLRRVDTSQGDVKRQVSNVAKAVMATYKFQTMGEYRALLSLYNVTVEEAHGMVDGREYHGLVYFPLSLNNSSATDDAGNKTGNPFKASRIGKSVGYEAVQRRFEFSKGQIRDKRLAEITRKTVAAALARTYRREEFVALLKAKGVDVVFRHTDEGRIYRQPSLTTARAAFSTARAWTRSFLPMPCRNISPCLMPVLRPCLSLLRWTGSNPKTVPSWSTTEDIPPVWACSAVTLRAHRRRKPLSSVTSNADGRNAAKGWGYDLFYRQLKNRNRLCHNRKTI